MLQSNESWDSLDGIIALVLARRTERLACLHRRPGFSLWHEIRTALHTAYPFRIQVLSGQLHDVVSTVVSGDSVHLMETDNPQDITGVGLTTGDRYQGAGVTRYDANSTGVLFPLAFTLVNAFHVIGTGPNNNFVIHETEHITVNADNTVVVMFDNVSVTCQ